MRLLSDDVLLPPREPEHGDEDVSAFLFECGGIFLTADDHGEVILWTPKYEVGRPTKTQKLAAALARGIDTKEVSDLDMFLIGGAYPSTFVRNVSPFNN